MLISVALCVPFWFRRSLTVADSWALFSTPTLVTLYPTGRLIGPVSQYFSFMSIVQLLGAWVWGYMMKNQKFGAFARTSFPVRDA